MSKTSTAFPLSPYSSATAKSNIETHTLSVLVDNEPGVLARVVGMFSGRGYNIESLTVAEVAHETHLSRITIVTSGTPEIIEQIRHQLERLVPVHSVKDLTLTVRAIERELAMIKVRGKGENRVEAMNLAEAFRAKVIDATVESFIFELTGRAEQDRRLRRAHAPAGLGRSVAHRCRRDLPWAGADLGAARLRQPVSEAGLERQSESVSSDSNGMRRHFRVSAPRYECVVLRVSRGVHFRPQLNLYNALGVLICPSALRQIIQ